MPGRRQRFITGCACCGHKHRDCGGLMCGCRLRRIEDANLALALSLNTTYFGIVRTRESLAS
jgi:hypothetical protein